MKKWIISLALTVAMLFTGCQTIKEETEAEPSQNTDQETSQVAETETTSQETEGKEEVNSEDTEASSSDAGEVVWEENLLDPENPVTIKFYSYSAASPAFGEGFQTLLDNFNNGPGKEKGVIVEYVMDDNAGTKIKADVKAGQQVDVLQGSFSNMGVYIDDIGLETFENWIPQEEMDAHFEGIPENCLQLGVVDDEMYALAFTFSTPMLFINESILEEAGITLDGPIETWDELYPLCEQVVENTDAEGLAHSETNASGWLTASIFKSNDSDVINDEGTEFVFADENGVEAMETINKFFEDGLAVGGTDGETAQIFQAGDAAFMTGSTALYSSTKAAFEENGWQLNGYPMPGFEGKENIPTNSGSGIMIRPDSEQKAQAIWEVIKYYTGDEGFTIITSEIGYLPLRPYLVEEEEYLKGYVEENPMIGRNIERLPYIERGPIWRGSNGAELKQLYLDMQAETLSPETDVRETMQKYADTMNQMLQAQ